MYTLQCTLTNKKRKFSEINLEAERCFIYQQNSKTNFVTETREQNKNSFLRCFIYQQNSKMSFITETGEQNKNSFLLSNIMKMVISVVRIVLIILVRKITKMV